jgi:hypothetical protein
MVSRNICEKNYINSRHDMEKLEHLDSGSYLVDEDLNTKQGMVAIEPKDLIGHTFVKDCEESGQRFRAHVVRAIVAKEFNIKKDPEYVKFCTQVTS